MPKDKEEKLQESAPEGTEETKEEVVEAVEADIPSPEPQQPVAPVQEAPMAEEINQSLFEAEVEEKEEAFVEQEVERTVTVQPLRFTSFDDSSQVQGEANKNLDILMDIKLQLTVELGRTELPIKKVLELTRGSIIELEKIAGEPVELYANGKLIAHGEVVVIEDHFGLRITTITEPEDRLKGV